ncbi:hypothetical protein TRVL_04019 [Trypanosoma vivax]|nr:hypothetical protein TRVL_04019 [Trypanosoma vivax]
MPSHVPLAATPPNKKQPFDLFSSPQNAPPHLSLLNLSSSNAAPQLLAPRLSPLCRCVPSAFYLLFCGRQLLLHVRPRHCSSSALQVFPTALPNAPLFSASAAKRPSPVFVSRRDVACSSYLLRPLKALNQSCK